MKEVNDKDDPLVVSNDETKVLPCENHLGNEEEKDKIVEGEDEEKEKEEVLKCENDENVENVENFKPDVEMVLLSKDLITVKEEVKEIVEELNKINCELSKPEAENTVGLDIKPEDNENNFQKQLILRPRKTEPNQNSEDSFLKKKQSKIGTRKTEKNCAINKEELSCSEISNVCVTDSDTKVISNLNPAGDDSINGVDLDCGVLSESKSDCVQNSTLSSENEGCSSENVSVAKSEDNSPKSKENSESETKVSSASENNHSKSAKKRRRNRDTIRIGTKKRKRPSGNRVKSDSRMLVPIGSGSRDAETTSPSSIENSTNGKRKCSEGNENSQKKSREFAVPSPSLAEINMKPAIPESTATSLEPAKPNLCLCRKKPEVYISGNNNAGDLYCQALDCIDTRIVGCCNPIPSKDVGLYRASGRASYQMMCEVHQQRLYRHNCCPVCGLFCAQGRYMMCKFQHHFHKKCTIENSKDVVICPHCGDDSSHKSVVVSIHSPKDFVFLPSQKPIRNTKSAKMSITRGNIQVEKEEDPIFQLPIALLAAAGTDGSVINGLAQALHREKLAHLLSIACRSFSKMCCSNRYSYKSLYNACHSGDAEKLLKILACGFNPNHVFEENFKQTPLHVAAANGNFSAVHILLQAKAELNVLDGELNTPLTTAINAKHNDIVKYLVKCGADVTVKSEDGMTPLHIAAKSGNVVACYHLLNATKLPPKYIDSLDDGGWTPMVWASEFNHLEVVKFLITKGADPLIKDAEQNIALHWAAFGGSIDIVELYLNDGSDINAVNVHGDTPLHIAARQDKYSCVLLLLARGAKSDIKNKSGELPRDCSESPSSDIYKAISLNMEIGALLTRFQDRSPKIISNDISRGKERNQIQCVNGVDDEEEPRDYVYVTQSCFTSKIMVDQTINSLQFCKCRENCSLDSCNCATISIKCWYDNEGRLKPEFNYSDPPMIFECNQACQCNRITCRNRVVQNGISCRFQLFRTEGKGWGIKTLNLIPKGTYVCEYIGEIISDCEADHREDDSYLFDLDNRDGETYCIDARHYGNFARFINHMCVPNLMPVHVFVDHQDVRFPRIAFFANRDISPDEELGYNYGEKFWMIKWKSFTCTCGAEKCIYSEETIHTTLDNYKKKLEENP